MSRMTILLKVASGGVVAAFLLGLVAYVADGWLFALGCFFALGMGAFWEGCFLGDPLDEQVAGGLTGIAIGLPLGYIAAHAFIQECGAFDKLIGPIILARTRNREDSVAARRQAVMRLGRCGSGGIPYLLRYLKDEDDVAFAASGTLGNIGSAAVLSLVEYWASDEWHCQW